MANRKSTNPSYVGYGMLTPVYIMSLDKLPKLNTGAVVHQVSEYVYDDAAIIACNLSQWGVPSGMIGTAVGDDLLGHHVSDTLKGMGVQGNVRFTKKYKTPLEVNVSDKKGARTYFWQRSEEILNTLDTASLSLIKNAKLLYVDWYDGDTHILRAMNEARRHNVPVFLNFEHGHQHPDLLRKYSGLVTVCQAVTDAAQLGKKQAMLGVARKLINSGIKTAIITMASQGCMAVQGDEIIRAYAPKVKAVDASGAGATFSSGFVYGYLNGWSLEETVRFAIAAASLKVTRSGLEMFPVSEIKGLARMVRIERMVYRGDRFRTIRKLLTLPPNSPLMNNPLVKESQKLAQKILPKKKVERRKIKRSMVE
ncbi:MAG: carbohydrate kinase family protein [Chloroflexi bacterium]|nr:carbohydrate kinase family protein [Chloroflexota bacterium]MBI3169519.1 carbohydrate kinase family protein [Chloroflexota bacterium]